MFENILTKESVTFKDLEEIAFKIACEFANEILRNMLEAYDKQVMDSRDTSVYRHKGKETTTIKAKTGLVEYTRTKYITKNEKGKNKCVYLIDSYIHSFEWLFIKEKQNASIEEQKAQIVRDKKQLTQYQQRLKEIDNLIQHIYEDNVSGKITDEMFSNFSTNYMNEQKDLKEKIEILSKNISTTEQKEIEITSFVDKVKKYTEIKELTPEIINELIDKILVHQQTKVDGKKYQQIDIYYLGVGIISISANEYDFEKEFQNMLKNKIKTA